MGKCLSKRWIAVLVTLLMVVSSLLSPVISVKTVYAEDETETEWIVLTGDTDTLTSGSYYLDQDIFFEDGLHIVGDDEVIIDLNGYILSADAERSSQVIVISGNLTLKDSSHGNGKVVGGGGGEGAGISVQAGTFTMEDGVITGNNATFWGGGVYVMSGANFIMKGGVITENSADYGGGIYVDGNATIEGGVITGNSANNGGGIYNEDGSLSIKNTEITENHASWGGGIYTNRGPLTLENVVITGNSASRGGGVYSLGSNVTMEDGVITGNSASAIGGGVYKDFWGSFTMSSGVIYGNTAGDYAADVYGNDLINSSLLPAEEMAGNTGDCSIINWYHDEEGSRYADTDEPEPFNVSEQPTDSVSLIVAYGITVSYDANGGEGTVPEGSYQEVTKKQTTLIASGQDLVAPNGSCSFLNWNTEKNGSGESYKPGTEGEFSQNTTLYAQWNHTWDEGKVTKEPTVKENGEIVYTCTVCGETKTEAISHLLQVRYYANKGQGTIEGGTFASGETFTVTSEKPWRLGYQFTGWNTKLDGTGITYHAGDEITITEDMMLYAQWEETDTFFVHYYENGGEFAEGFIHFIYVNSGDTFIITSEEPTREGYEFTGWNTQEYGSGTSYSAGDEIIVTDIVLLYAQWKESGESGTTYKVTYDVNGGSGTITDDTEYASGDTVIVTSEKPTREGYDFTGWNTEADGTGIPYSAEDEFAITENITLYAQWKESGGSGTTYKVTFDVNGGSGTITDDTEYASGDIVTVTSKEPTREGYEFIGWNTKADGTGTSYHAGDEITITGNLTLYAQWEESGKVTCSVTYDVNGGPDGTITDDTQYAPGDTFVVKYEFIGWNTEKDGSGIFYSIGDTVTITENMTLYAQWREIEIDKFKVTYNVNGGSGTITDDTEYASGATFTVTAKEPTREGYEFTGWNTKADGTGVSYSAGDEGIISGNLTLYAQWKENGRETYKVTYDVNGGTGTITDDTEYSLGDTFTVVSEKPTRSGYSFQSWNTDKSGTGTRYSAGDTGTITGNITLYARWTSDSGNDSSGGGGGGGSSSSSSSSSSATTSDEEEIIEEEEENEENEVVYPFTDVTNPSMYYFDAIVWAKEKGITAGYPNGMFGVQDVLNRADMACFLYRLAGSPNTEGIINPFWDVAEEDYFYDAVCWGYANNIIAGISPTEFAPYETCTREQYISLLYRRSGSPAVDGALNFSDTEENAYYYNGIVWAVENEYAYGYSNGMFGVGDAALRVDVITVLYRMEK